MTHLIIFEQYQKVGISKLEEILLFSKAGVTPDIAEQYAFFGFYAEEDGELIRMLHERFAAMNIPDLEALKEYFIAGISDKKVLHKIITDDSYNEVDRNLLLSPGYAKVLAQHGLQGKVDDMIEIAREISFNRFQIISEILATSLVNYNDIVTISEVPGCYADAERFRMEQAWRLPASFVSYVATYANGTWVNKRSYRLLPDTVLCQGDDEIVTEEGIPAKIYLTEKIKQYIDQHCHDAYESLKQKGVEVFKIEYLESLSDEKKELYNAAAALYASIIFGLLDEYQRTCAVQLKKIFGNISEEKA
ncbi:hypothetical protein HZA96_00155 [Candidatus Woesearchaeota archaeon]|nr:hypothetical protein [Candidatus Woesearchaeota archaeon]